MNIYYVYAYISKHNHPYYIGKGCKNRAFKNKLYAKIPKDKSKIIFLGKDMSEESAFDLEKKMIKYFGRKDNGTGVLLNLTDGGEGCLGIRHTVKSKKLISEAQKKIWKEKNYIPYIGKGELVEYYNNIFEYKPSVTDGIYKVP